MFSSQYSAFWNAKQLPLRRSPFGLAFLQGEERSRLYWDGSLGLDALGNVYYHLTEGDFICCLRYLFRSPSKQMVRRKEWIHFMNLIVIHLPSQKSYGNANQEPSVHTLWDFGTFVVYPFGDHFCLLPFIDLQPKTLTKKNTCIVFRNKTEVATEWERIAKQNPKGKGK